MKLRAVAEGVDVTVRNAKAEDIFQAMDLMFQLLMGMGFHTNSIMKGIKYLNDNYVPAERPLEAAESVDTSDIDSESPRSFIGAPGEEPEDVTGFGLEFKTGKS